MRILFKIIKVIFVIILVLFITITFLFFFSLFDKRAPANPVNTEARNVDTIRAGVKNIYGGSDSYRGLSNEILLAARILPENMLSADRIKIVNGFGGNVVVKPVSFNSNKLNAFEIVYTNVPLEYCVRFINTGGHGFNKITVSGVIVKDTTFGNILDNDKVTSQCNTYERNTVIFTTL